MVTFDQLAPSPDDNDAGFESFLEENDSFIIAKAREEMPRSVGPSDSDDLAQNVRINVWLVWKRQAISNPRPYINRAIHNGAIDIYRKDKSYQAVNTDDFEELDKGAGLVPPSKYFDNPEAIVEEREEVTERLEMLMKALKRLHRCQQLISLYNIRKKVDDVDELDAFLAEVDIDADVQLPVARDERQLLRASYPAAKRNLARYMNVRLPQKKMCRKTS